MNIALAKQSALDTTEGCRYCLMCRHVCPVTRVTYNEATSPHGWALTVASVRRGLLDWNAETADLLYQCADCGLCQSFCVTDQPLPYAIVEARAEILAAGHAPAAVAEIEAALRQSLQHDADRAELAEVVLFGGAANDVSVVLEAVCGLLEHLGIAHGSIAAGRDSGYLAYTLGLTDIARELARATLAEIERSGCHTLLVLSPEDAHALTNLYPLLGAPLPDGVAVVEMTALLANCLEEGRLRLRPADLDLVYHDPCQTPRRDGRWRAPRQLLEALTTRPLHEAFWRAQRAASCGASGGLPWTQPKLAAQMARAALADATNGGAGLVVTDAPGCLAHLRAHAGEGVEVRGLYELLLERLEES